MSRSGSKLSFMDACGVPKRRHRRQSRFFPGVAGFSGRNGQILADTATPFYHKEAGRQSGKPPVGEAGKVVLKERRSRVPGP